MSNIIKLLEDSGLSDEELCELFSISESMIKKWKAGEGEPHEAIIRAIRDKLAELSR